jgi:hypothetical protein
MTTSKGYGSRISNRTKTLIRFAKASEVGLDPRDGPFSVVCKDHGNSQQFKRWREARNAIPNSDQWCRGCKSMVPFATRKSMVSFATRTSEGNGHPLSPFELMRRQEVARHERAMAALDEIGPRGVPQSGKAVETEPKPVKPEPADAEPVDADPEPVKPADAEDADAEPEAAGKFPESGKTLDSARPLTNSPTRKRVEYALGMMHVGMTFTVVSLSKKVLASIRCTRVILNWLWHHKMLCRLKDENATPAIWEHVNWGA